VGITALFSTGALLTRTSVVWPTANLALFVPVPCPGPFIIRRLAWENGSAVSGNVDMGVYTSEGQLVVSTGSTAQAGTSVFQAVNITDTLIPPGLYYLALVLNNGTGQFARGSVSNGAMRALGAYEMASAFALPSSSVRAAWAGTYLPSMMATGVDTV
jgi:hypothetical protein